MKTFRVASLLTLLVIALTMIFAPVVQAQPVSTKYITIGTNNKLIDAKFLVTLQATKHSDAFSIGGFAGESFYTYAPEIGYSVLRTTAADADSLVTITISGSYGGLTTSTWDIVDTVVTATGDMTMGSATPVQRATATTLNLNGRKYPYYRFDATGTTTNTSATVELWWYLYRADNK